MSGSGFKLWEIDEMLRDAIAAADDKIDQETGEIPPDWSIFLDDVQMTRDAKCLSIAAYIKECKAEAEAIAAEAKALQRRAKTCQNKADRLKEYLARSVRPGEKLSDSRTVIGWRKSTVVVLDNESALPESCFRIVKEVSKTTVKEMLENDRLEAGTAHFETRQNISIK
jgi:hypothetical protein